MKSELLLPVGNMSMCLAAIHHGADAIYLGVPFFNARGRTTDFSLEELKEMMELCHLYGVKVNLAFNVVIFEEEIPKVIELLEKILPLGPDAFIVQDLGLAKLIRDMAPHQRIHASTQMTVTNADAMKLVEDLNIDRFVLGRENSISDIQLIRASTDKEIEVFVHGALCVAYSGQCFTSESLGGRSANRGQCAQSCRLEYEMYVDNEKKDLGDKKYLVSPKDLMGIAEIPELIKAGVNSFKVEGRLKTPEYVAAAAKNYREVMEGNPLNLSRRTLDLSTTYSRGFFTGWLHGVDHQRLVEGTFSAHRGLEIGKVVGFRKNVVVISSTQNLESGMGLLFVDKKEVGSKIFSVKQVTPHFEVELLDKHLELTLGQKVYLNSHEGKNKEWQKGWQSREHMKKIPLKLLVQGCLNEPLLVKVIDPEGREVYAQTLSVLTSSLKQPLTNEFLKAELSSLGASVYELASFECFLSEGVFMNHRELKELRRSFVSRMNEERTKTRVKTLKTPKLPLAMISPASQMGKLNVLLRTKTQVDGFIESYKAGYFDSSTKALSSIILDFEFGKDYASSVQALKALGLFVGMATSRILKPGEYHHLKMIARLNPDKILVRNLGALEFLRSETKLSLEGDFSLNATNSMSVTYLLSKGLDSVNVSYDLNQEQLMDLVSHSDASKLEVTLHQYMPEFHMEHCVFAAFLSNGHSFKDCGKPCEKHEVKLKDPYGNWHHLKADQECRNTFFKATPQSASFLVKELMEKGVGTFRLEALDEAPTELNHKILTYLKLMTGEFTSKAAFEELKLLERYGLGLGQMGRKDTYKDRKKELPL